MNLLDVAVLVEAVDGGSLAEAARRLELAPMAVSRRLAGLERRLGVRLVQRTTRSLSLTAEGEAFLPHARAMLENANLAAAAVAPEANGASGLLRVTASMPFGRKVVAPMAAGFLRTHAEMRLDLLLTDSVIDIVAQGIDVAIRIAPIHDSTLIARRLADSPRQLYASPAYLAERGRPSRLADLDRHECLAFTGSTHWTFQHDGRSSRRRVASRFTSSSLEALHQACIAGLGIATLATWNADEDVAAGRLVALPLADAQPGALGIWAVYPSARQVPARLRLFLAALEAHLQSPRTA